MRVQYNEWTTSEMLELTRTGKIRKPSYSTLAKWVKQAWDDVDIGDTSFGQIAFYRNMPEGL